jgi:hypothetical protein
MAGNDRNTPKRVKRWRIENREEYNAYMRELRKKNPSINMKNALRRARLRAKAAGHAFNEDEWRTEYERRRRG